MGSTNSAQTVLGPILIVVSVTALLFVLAGALTPGYGLPGTDMSPEQPDSNVSTPTTVSSGTDSPAGNVSGNQSAGVAGSVVAVHDASTVVIDVGENSSVVRVAGVVTPAASETNVSGSDFEEMDRECVSAVAGAGERAVREQFLDERVVVVPAGSSSSADVRAGESVTGYVVLRSEMSASVSGLVLGEGYGVVGSVPRPVVSGVGDQEELRSEFLIQQGVAQERGVGVWAC